MLKDVEDERLNDSLGNPGLISPDKEDLSRLLVRNASPVEFYCFVPVFFLACASHSSPHVALRCADGAFQRTHPRRNAARQEDHRDGHRGPGAREVRSAV